MKKLLIGLAIAGACGGAIANEQDAEQVNYGDPTASFSSLGVSASEDSTQLNGMIGLGSNIFQLDLGVDNKSGDMNYRGRYFHVTDGLGYSVDVLGDKDNTTALAGAIYKFQVTDNIMLFPMASVGYTTSDAVEGEGERKAKSESALGQLGLYGMYGFDAGHWIYANPKATYHEQSKEWIPQIEVGGGYMILDNASIGAKVEYTGESSKKNLVKKEDTVAWLQASYYF
ncbi:hypothetical protein [Vibrio superstes]|uniref:Outer membrane protein beta-barrel domain-containing protein n=1 Tax=Vibrio superstes NBRC 103154 TaxID=1219062 RepID=A0A511QMQ5_9VIBR|nr:hypothetical protein [Vibrio superstes]GEM78605.1 hypothetical protein VSU01S_08500 [Vibrio superstes NBRC 103154]